MNICLNYFDVFGVLFNYFNEELNKSLFLFGINKLKNRFFRVQKSVQNSLLCTMCVQFLHFLKSSNYFIINLLSSVKCLKVYTFTRFYTNLKKNMCKFIFLKKMCKSVQFFG